MRTLFEKQQNVISQRLSFAQKEKGLVVGWEKVRDGTITRLVVGARNHFLFQLFLATMCVLFLLGAHFYEIDYREVGNAMFYLISVALVGVVYYIYRGIFSIHDIADEELRRVVHTVVFDTFRFLWYFGHWPENMTKEEVEHVLGRRHKQLLTHAELISPANRLRQVRYEQFRGLAEKFFGKLVPIGATDGGLARSVRV